MAEINGILYGTLVFAGSEQEMALKPMSDMGSYSVMEHWNESTNLRE